MIAATKAPKKKPKPKKDKAAKAKSAKAKKPKPEMIQVDRLEWEHKLACDALAAEIEVDAARFADMKKAAMEVKAAMSGKQVRLRRMHIDGPERLPLFDGNKAAKPQAVKGKNGNAAPPTVDSSAEVEADAWRKAPLKESIWKPGDANLTKGVNALQKAGIETVGQLEDRRGSGGLTWTDGIDNFGPEAQTAVEDAVIDFLSRTRDKAVLEQAKAEAAAKQAETNGHVAGTNGEATAAESETAPAEKPKRKRVKKELAAAFV